MATAWMLTGACGRQHYTSVKPVNARRSVNSGSAERGVANMSSVQFGVLLKNARRRAGMTQRQLADLSTISVRAIRDLELERTRSPRAETVKLLADALRLNDSRRAELAHAATGRNPNEPLLGELTAPTPLGPIIGRDHEIASLIGMLERDGYRLINVAGIPGIGKTRLIQEVAVRLHRSESMPAICLERKRAEGQVTAESGDALIRRIADPLACGPNLDELIGALGTSRILITVDGRDLDQDAELSLRLILRRCPGIRVLYETREPAPSFNEATFWVFPLALSEWGYGEGPVADLSEYSSVQFLCAHSVQLHGESVSDPRVLKAIAGICWCLDGNPAALEAAASWLLIYDANELLETAMRFPLMLTRSPSRPWESITAWLKQAVVSLPHRDREFLRWLAEIEPWTVEKLVNTLGSSTVEALRGVHTLRARGLLRRTDPLNRERPRFTVLNLVRHLLRSDSELGPEQAMVAIPDPSAVH